LKIVGFNFEVILISKKEEKRKKLGSEKEIKIVRNNNKFVKMTSTTNGVFDKKSFYFSATVLKLSIVLLHKIVNLYL
jgi:hypothetical protein